MRALASVSICETRRCAPCAPCHRAANLRATVLGPIDPLGPQLPVTRARMREDSSRHEGSQRDGMPDIPASPASVTRWGHSSRRVLGRVRTRTVPGRLAGKTTDFGSVNEGSNPSPGAVKAVRYLTILSSAAAHDLFGPALDLVVKVTTAADVNAETAVIGLPHVLSHGLRVVTLQRWGQELFGLRAGDF